MDLLTIVSSVCSLCMVLCVFPANEATSLITAPGLWKRSFEVRWDEPRLNLRRSIHNSTWSWNKQSIVKVKLETTHLWWHWAYNGDPWEGLVRVDFSPSDSSEHPPQHSGHLQREKWFLFAWLAKTLAVGEWTSCVLSCESEKSNDRSKWKWVGAYIAKIVRSVLDRLVIQLQHWICSRIQKVQGSHFSPERLLGWTWTPVLFQVLPYVDRR